MEHQRDDAGIRLAKCICADLSYRIVGNTWTNTKLIRIICRIFGTLLCCFRGYRFIIVIKEPIHYAKTSKSLFGEFIKRDNGKKSMSKYSVNASKLLLIIIIFGNFSCAAGQKTGTQAHVAPFFWMLMDKQMVRWNEVYYNWVRLEFSRKWHGSWGYMKS